MEIVLKLGDTSLLSLLQTLFSALLIHANGLEVKVRTVRYQDPTSKFKVSISQARRQRNLIFGQNYREPE